MSNNNNFEYKAPKLVQEAMNKAGALAQTEQDFIHDLNSTFAGVYNMWGMDEIHQGGFNDPLAFMSRGTMPTGAFIRQLSFRVKGWIDNPTKRPANIGETELRAYMGEIKAYYSKMRMLINTPFGIPDNDIKEIVAGGGDVSSIHTGFALESFSERSRLLYGGKLHAIHRSIVDHITPEATIEIPIDSIITDDDGELVSTAIKELGYHFDTDTSPYNPDGYVGQKQRRTADGKLNYVILGRPAALAKLTTKAGKNFHRDSTGLDDFEMIPVANFGGMDSEIQTMFDAVDGRQTADLRPGPWTDPHADVQFVVMTKETFMVTTDWDNVETKRFDLARTTRFSPQSMHTFARIMWEPMAIIKFVGKQEPEEPTEP